MVRVGGGLFVGGGSKPFRLRNKAQCRGERKKLRGEVGGVRAKQEERGARDYRQAMLRGKKKAEQLLNLSARGKRSGCQGPRGPTFLQERKEGDLEERDLAKH